MDRQTLQENYGLLGESGAMHQVVDKLLQVAKTDITILLQGESGVGKDVTARAIHAMSHRSKEHLVIVNCGAIPEGIIESELFGHEKGSFTGAHEAREGYFEKADGGTIFLDEIADTPKNIQVKLLRVLESGEFFRVGSSKMYKTDVRVIAATNKDLWGEVQNGNFREDLYYRLDTVKIKLPALRERQEDIIPLFRKFVNEFSAKYDSSFRGFSSDAEDLLTSYRWPGNIRELKNVAEQLVVMEKSQHVDKETLQKYLKGRQRKGSADNLPMVSEAPPRPGDQTENRRSSSDEINLIYRALVDMRSELSDMKRLMVRLIYPKFNASDVKALPEARPGNVDPNNIVVYLDEDGEEQLGIYRPSEQRIPGERIPAEHNPDERFPAERVPASGVVVPGSSVRQVADPGAARGYGRTEHADGREKDDRHTGIHIDEDQIPSIAEMEKILIQQALKKYDGNRRRVSDVLGISERTLYRKLDQYGIQ